MLTRLTNDKAIKLVKLLSLRRSSDFLLRCSAFSCRGELKYQVLMYAAALGECVLGPEEGVL